MAKKIATALILQRCYDFINQFSTLYISHMLNRHHTRIKDSLALRQEGSVDGEDGIRKSLMSSIERRSK